MQKQPATIPFESRANTDAISTERLRNTNHGRSQMSNAEPSASIEAPNIQSNHVVPSTNSLASSQVDLLNASNSSTAATKQKNVKVMKIPRTTADTRHPNVSLRATHQQNNRAVPVIRVSRSLSSVRVCPSS